MRENITIATLAYGPIAPVWELARHTWEPYCIRHGYLLHVETTLLDPSIAPSWNKCLTVARLLRETGCPVWWVDADMTITKADFNLEWPVPGGWNDLNVSVDWNGFCFGLFRALPNQWTINFLEFVPMLGDVADPTKFGRFGCKWEQNTIKLLAQEFPKVDKHIGSLPGSWVNDNPHTPREGDVIWHFGGRSIEERTAMIHKAHPQL